MTSPPYRPHYGNTALTPTGTICVTQWANDHSELMHVGLLKRMCMDLVGRWSCTHGEVTLSGLEPHASTLVVGATTPQKELLVRLMVLDTGARSVPFVSDKQTSC